MFIIWTGQKLSLLVVETMIHYHMEIFLILSKFSNQAVALQVDYKYHTESCFRHPLFDLRGTRKVEIRHTNFHFSSKKVTSKSRKVEVFDLTTVKKLSTFRPKKAKVEKLKSRKVEKLKSRKVEKLKS